MEKKIINYFKDRYLKILDGGTPANKNYGTTGYNAVTFDYIYRYLLKCRYSKKNLASKLMELDESNKIRIAPCGNVENVVFFGNNQDSIYWWRFYRDKDNNLEVPGCYMYNDKMEKNINLLNNNK